MKTEKVEVRKGHGAKYPFSRLKFSAHLVGTEVKVPVAEVKY